MFGFVKKKKKEDIAPELRDLNKKEVEIHKALQEKVKEYLLEDETIHCEGRLAKYSYFTTNKRIISIMALNSKLKGVQVDSHYYSNMSGIKYSESFSKKLNYDIITIDLKGTIQKLTIQLPSEVTKEMYKIISNYISVKNI